MKCCCFASRRKTLRNNAVAAGFSAEKIVGGLRELGLPEAVRAEALSPSELAALYARIGPARSGAPVSGGA